MQGFSWYRNQNNKIYILNTKVFADKLIYRNESRLIKYKHIFIKIIQIYNFEITETKSKVMAFKGRQLLRSTIILQEYILQVSNLRI